MNQHKLRRNFTLTRFYDSLNREHSSHTYDWKRVKVIYGSILYFVESFCLVLSVVCYHLLQYSLYAKGKYWFFFEETLWLHHQYRFIYWCNILLQQREYLTWCQFEGYWTDIVIHEPLLPYMYHILLGIFVIATNLLKS